MTAKTMEKNQEGWRENVEVVPKERVIRTETVGWGRGSMVECWIVFMRPEVSPSMAKGRKGRQAVKGRDRGIGSENT